MNTFESFFFLLGLIVFMGCEDQHTVKMSAETYDELMGVLSRSIQQKQELRERAIYDLEQEMKSQEKNKYLPIINALYLIQSNMIEFKSLIESFQNGSVNSHIKDKMEILRILRTNLEVRGAKLTNIYEMTLVDNLKTLSLTKVQGANKKQSIKKAFEEILEQPFYIGRESRREQIFQLKILLLQERALEYQRFLQDDLVNLTKGTTMCGFVTYFPVVQPVTNCINKGDFFEAKISLGIYSSDISSSLVKIIVNSDTLDVNELGTANYKIMTQKRGQAKLDLKCLIENPLTGELTTGESEYIYVVQ